MIITRPSRIHAAYNPIRIEVTGDDTIRVTFATPAGDETVTLSRIAVEGVIATDVSGIVRNLFREGRDAVATVTPGDWAWVDRALKVDYLINNEQYTAVNAAARPGAEINFAARSPILAAAGVTPLRFGVDVPGRNLRTASNSPDRFNSYMGSDVVKSVVSVPAWGATDANRVQASGGTSAIQVLASLMSTPTGVHTQSCWFRNNGTNVITITPNGGAVNGMRELQPGEDARVVFTGTFSTLQFQVRVSPVGVATDFTWWRTKIETGAIATDWTPATQDEGWTPAAGSDIAEYRTSRVKYAGLPTGVSIVNNRTGAIQVRAEFTAVPDENLNIGVNDAHNHLTVEFTPGTEPDLTALQVMGSGMTPPYRVEFIDECTPENGAYVRWINTIGGYEYRMFEQRATRTIAVSGVKTFRGYAPDNVDNTRPVVEYAKDAEERLTLGAYDIPRDEVLRLVALPLSPRVELWDSDTEKWIGLTCNNISNGYESDPLASSVEFSFTVTAINLQF